MMLPSRPFRHSARPRPRSLPSPSPCSNTAPIRTTKASTARSASWTRAVRLYLSSCVLRTRLPARTRFSPIIKSRPSKAAVSARIHISSARLWLFVCVCVYAGGLVRFNVFMCFTFSWGLVQCMESGPIRACKLRLENAREFFSVQLIIIYYFVLSMNLIICL